MYVAGWFNKVALDITTASVWAISKRKSTTLGSGIVCTSVSLWLQTDGEVYSLKKRAVAHLQVFVGYGRVVSKDFPPQGRVSVVAKSRL